MEESKEKKLTLKKVGDDLIGGGLVALGLVGGSVAMKMLSSKFKLNPYYVAAGGLAIGIAGKVVSNYIDNKAARDSAKDIATGIISAGALDLTGKLLSAYAPNLLPADTLPKLSGQQDYAFNSSMLSGVTDTPYEEVKLTSDLLQ